MASRAIRPRGRRRLPSCGIFEEWKSQQLARVFVDSGMMEGLASFLTTSMVCSSALLCLGVSQVREQVSKQEAQSVDGMLGQINMWPRLQELWATWPTELGPTELGPTQLELPGAVAQVKCLTEDTLSCWPGVCRFKDESAEPSGAGFGDVALELLADACSWSGTTDEGCKDPLLRN